MLGLIRERRTVHNFLPQRPPEETILRAIDAARWAPNHYLTEPWRFYLLGPESADAIARLNSELVRAAQGPNAARAKLERWRTVPGWLLVTCALSADPVRAREDYAACCCAVQNLLLALWSEGIGVKWTTGEVTRSPRLYELLGIDAERESVVAMLWYGYAAVVPKQSRKDVDAIVSRRP
jgi:nitroreductase